jgi:hypothetical protein
MNAPILLSVLCGPATDAIANRSVEIEIKCLYALEKILPSLGLDEFVGADLKPHSPVYMVRIFETLRRADQVRSQDFRAPFQQSRAPAPGLDVVERNRKKDQDDKTGKGCAQDLDVGELQTGS